MDKQTCCLQWLYYKPVFESYPRAVLNIKTLGLTRICDVSLLCPVGSVQEISANKCDLVHKNGFWCEPVMERVRLSPTCAISCCVNHRKLTFYYYFLLRQFFGAVISVIFLPPSVNGHKHVRMIVIHILLYMEKCVFHFYYFLSF